MVVVFWRKVLWCCEAKYCGVVKQSIVAFEAKYCGVVKQSIVAFEAKYCGV